MIQECHFEWQSLVYLHVSPSYYLPFLQSAASLLNDFLLVFYHFVRFRTDTCQVDDKFKGFWLLVYKKDEKHSMQRHFAGNLIELKIFLYRKCSI